MKHVAFITSSPDKLKEVSTLLADFIPALTMVCKPPTISPTMHTLDNIIQEATASLKRCYTGTPCFLELPALVLDTHGVLITASSFADMGETEFISTYNGM